jgi:hypothetical protein
MIEGFEQKRLHRWINQGLAPAPMQSLTVGQVWQNSNLSRPQIGPRRARLPA